MIDMILTDDQMTREILRDAYEIGATYSRDPSTQNGAILVGHNGDILSTGYNRFPDGVHVTPDRLERPKKYAFVMHAEVDSILSAARERKQLVGSVLYQPWFACDRCATVIIAAGVTKCIGHRQAREKIHPNWMEAILYGDEMLDEAGVIREYYDGEIGDVETRFNYETWKP